PRHHLEEIEELASRQHTLWWQWTTWPRLVMTEIGNTPRSSVLEAPAHGLPDGSLGPLAAHLHGLEARVAALEAHLLAGPLMTPADAAEHARVAVETIRRAIRGGELSVAGYVGRSPRLSRDAVDGWLAETSPPAAAVSRRRRRRCGRKASEAVEAAWQELG
ncbi:MAG: helix-turn-helix domain-containing protein, partial [Solirubrobacteraceae bacterium]